MNIYSNDFRQLGLVNRLRIIHALSFEKEDAAYNGYTFRLIFPLLVLMFYVMSKTALAENEGVLFFIIFIVFLVYFGGNYFFRSLGKRYLIRYKKEVVSIRKTNQQKDITAYYWSCLLIYYLFCFVLWFLMYVFLN